MAVHIRSIEPDEVGSFLAAMRVGFHQGEPPAALQAARAEEFAREIEYPRTQMAFDGDRVVGTYRSFPTELTVPGGFVAADAVSNVTVSPTHRRQGLLSTMIRADLAAAAERGEAVAILIAAEWPIYGRYGFGPAVQNVEYEIDARGASFAQPGAGEVALVEAAALRAAAPGVYEAHRRVTPGAIERSGSWWDHRLGLAAAVWPEPPATQRFALVHDADGAPAGLLVYAVEGIWDEWRPRSVLTVGELLGATADAQARLWQFACEVDLVSTVRADDRGVDDSLPFLLEDGRAVRERYRTDYQWLRVLDVPAALSARRYASDGALVLEVDDPLGHTAGRFALEGGPQEARCAATTAAPDLTLRAGALGAAYLGGASLAALQAAGWVREERPGALARADAMLGWAVPPWCATLF